MDHYRHTLHYPTPPPVFVVCSDDLTHARLHLANDTDVVFSGEVVGYEEIKDEINFMSFPHAWPFCLFIMVADLNELKIIQM